MFDLIVIESLRGCQLHPELCPDPEHRQDYAHDGHEERQLDLVREHNTKRFQYEFVTDLHIRNLLLACVKAF